MSNQFIHRSLTIAILVILGPASASADGVDKSEISSLRFVGAPSDRARNYVIFESSYKTLLSGSNRRAGKSDFLFTSDMGIMHNLDSNYAVGASFYVSGDDDGSKVGIRPRFRKWLSKKATLDVSAGLILSGSARSIDIVSPGYVASVSVGKAGWFSVDAHLEIVRFPSKTETSLYAGASGRGFFAFVPPLVIFVLIAASYDK